LSTKADITIEGENNYYIYCRYDGFPEVVIPDINEILQRYFQTNQTKSLFDYITKKLNISIKDTQYSLSGHGVHMFKDGQDPWRQFEYFIKKNGDIEYKNLYTEEHQLIKLEKQYDETIYN